MMMRPANQIPSAVRSVVLAILTTAACAPGPASIASQAASSIQSTQAPSAPVTPTPTPGRTPRFTPLPTVPLPPLVDLVEAGAETIRANPSPDFAAVADGSVYVSGVARGVARFDAAGTLRENWAIEGASCGAFAVGFGAVWTATCDGPGLARIAIATGDLTPIAVGGLMPASEASVGAGEGAVWMVVGRLPSELVKVDPESGEVLERFELPGRPTAVRAGLGGVWVSDPERSVIHRVAPSTGKIVATIQVGQRPQFLEIGEGSVWTMNQLGQSVTRIDPETNQVVATIRLGEVVEGGDIAVGGGFVWLHSSTTLLFKIDPETNEVVARYGPSSGSGGVAADDANVWITAHDIRTIWRLPLP